MPREDIASRWKLNDETPYTGCDRCRQIKPPIYEVVYQASSWCPQYHYFCEPCAIREMGETNFRKGLKDVAQRKEIKKRGRTSPRAETDTE